MLFNLMVQGAMTLMETLFRINGILVMVNTGLGVNPTHKYDNYGIYNVTLIVTDDDGLTDTDGTLAIINKGTPPIIQLLYPTDGEVLNGTVSVKWYAHDVQRW